MKKTYQMKEDGRNRIRFIVLAMVNITNPDLAVDAEYRSLKIMMLSMSITIIRLMGQMGKAWMASRQREISEPRKLVLSCQAMSCALSVLYQFAETPSLPEDADRLPAYEQNFSFFCNSGLTFLEKRLN